MQTFGPISFPLFDMGFYFLQCAFVIEMNIHATIPQIEQTVSDKSVYYLPAMFRFF